MLGNLYSVGFCVIPKNIRRRVGKEAQESTFARIDTELGRATSWRSYPDTATKSAEPREVFFFIGRQFQWRCYLVSRWQSIIFYPKIVVESIRPELDVEVRSVKHARIEFATVRCACSTGPFWLDESAPVGRIS